MSRSASVTRARPRARSFPVLPIGAGAVVLAVAVAVAVGIATDEGGEGVPASQAVVAPLSETRPVVVSGAALPPAAGPGVDPAGGRPIPEVRGASFGGEPVGILRDGRPKLVVFLAHWCSHCRDEVPGLVEWSAAGGPEGVELVAVSTAADPSRPNYPPSAWLADAGWTIPTVADDDAGRVAEAFGLTGFPYFVAVDAEGDVVARVAGALSIPQLELLASAARG